MYKQTWLDVEEFLSDTGWVGSQVKPNVTVYRQKVNGVIFGVQIAANANGTKGEAVVFMQQKPVFPNKPMSLKDRQVIEQKARKLITRYTVPSKCIYFLDSTVDKASKKKQ